MKSSTTLAALVAHCRKLARRQQRSDAELLRRFVKQREAAAFEELVERYAPLVWSACRRILPSEADCEDAFQAAFLCLVRQAGSIDPNRPLGAWLHTIAVRTAAKARSRLRRQRTQAIIPEQTTCGDLADELSNRELFQLVDEEIARLPALLREPFVLCCLEGQTRDEAAAMLRCSVAAVKSRLERSRNLLRKRLERRGIGLPAAFLVLGLSSGSVQASLRAKALQCMLGSAPSAVASLVPAASMSLASKLTLTAMSLVLASALSLGAFRVMEAEPPKEAAAPAKAPAPPSPIAENTSQRLDRFGDPLPPGAIRRFGTLRLRHDYSILHLAFTPDSKQLIAGMAPRPLAIFDVATGRRLRTIGSSTAGNHWGFAVSPDGKRIVCGVVGNLWELQTGKLIRQLSDGACQWWSVAFSPDGKIVAGAKELESEIVLVEADTGKQLAHQTFKQERGRPRQILGELCFSPDGKFLAALFSQERKLESGGTEIRPSQIWLMDAAKGTLVRTFGSAEDRIYSFAFQPDTGRLAAAGKHGVLRFWDVKTGQEVHRIATGIKQEYWGILSFLADGRRCVLSAFDDKSETAYLLIIDVKDGKELRRIKLGEGRSPIVLSPDGRTVATANHYSEPCVRLWDVESGRERLGDAGHRTPATLSLSADGRTLISRGEEGRVIHWDLRTGNGQIKEEHKQTSKWVLINPQVLAPSEEGQLRGPRWRLTFHYKTSEIEVKSRDGSKLLRKVKWPSTAMWDIRLSPDGSHVVVPVQDNKHNSVLLWNPERDNEPHKLTGPPSSPPFGYHRQNLLFTHDSKQLLIGYCTHNPSPPNALWLWDVATAKAVRKLPIKFSADHLVLSSDDRVLLRASSWEDPTVHVWDMETGREIVTLTDPLLPLMEAGKYEMGRYISSLHLSADERFLAVVTNRGDSSGISIWETAAWKLVRTFPWTRAQNHPPSMIISRDRRSLFVANSDSTILEWDVSGRAANGRRQPADKIPNTDRLNELWQTLAKTPDKAYPAVWELLDHPAESLPFLIDKLAPVQPVEEKRVRQLLTRLDSESFAEREEASRQLLALGEQVMPLLRQALKRGSSLEAKKRIEGAIESLSSVPGSDQIRLLRALAVLEWSNRPEAAAHLQRLAGGAPSASLTQAAKAALQRLKR